MAAFFCFLDCVGLSEEKNCFHMHQFAYDDDDSNVNSEQKKTKTKHFFSFQEQIINRNGSFFPDALWNQNNAHS